MGFGFIAFLNTQLMTTHIHYRPLLQSHSYTLTHARTHTHTHIHISVLSHGLLVKAYIIPFPLGSQTIPLSQPLQLSTNYNYSTITLPAYYISAQTARKVSFPNIVAFHCRRNRLVCDDITH
jgi:hypothetical protein